MAGFLGMRGNGDWVTDQRPKSWREAILFEWPNGMAPLTALMSKMKSERVTDPEFNWWTKELSSRAGAVTGVYTDASLAVAYTSGGVTGDSVYVKMAEALVTEFRLGHEVMLQDDSDPTMTVVGEVTARLANGASSYVKVLLLEDDDNSSAGDLSDCDRIMVIGSVQPEGSAMPDSIAYDPIKWYNYTQIFEYPLEMTRTALETRLRTGDQYREAKREALQFHSIDMEKAFLFGVPSEGIGDNNQKKRSTLGLIPAIRGGYTGVGGSTGTVSDFKTDSNYAGQTWLQAGEHWLDTQLEIMFRYGTMERLAFCGSLALLALQRLVKNRGDFAFNPATRAYGIQVVEWVTPFGKINLMTHPLFSQDTTLRDQMVIFEPEKLVYKYITDTTYKKDDALRMNTGYTSRDGIKESFLTECGLEYHNPIAWGYLTSLGSNNTAS